MAEIEMSRKELINKLATVAYLTLGEHMYVLKTVGKYAKACMDEFGINEDEAHQLIELLTIKVLTSDASAKKL